MSLTSSIGYTNFTIFLMLLTGGFILWVEVKGYERKGMKKEKRMAKFLGWFNIVAGLGTLIFHLIYQNMQL